MSMMRDAVCRIPTGAWFLHFLAINACPRAVCVTVCRVIRLSGSGGSGSGAEARRGGPSYL